MCQQILGYPGFHARLESPVALGYRAGLVPLEFLVVHGCPVVLLGPGCLVYLAALKPQLPLTTQILHEYQDYLVLHPCQGYLLDGQGHWFNLL